MEGLRPPSLAVKPEVPAPAPRAAPASEPRVDFKQVLEGLGKQVDRGQRMMHGVLHTSSALQPQQLLALQAGIYRYAEVIDLTTKLVDRTTNALKTTLQSQ